MHIKLVSIALLFISLANSCSSIKNQTQSKNLKYQNNEVIITVEIVSDHPYIDSENPTKIKVKSVNLDVNELGFAAPFSFNLLESNSQNNEVILEINPKMGKLQGDYFNFVVTYGTISHTFLIPYK